MANASALRNRVERLGSEMFRVGVHDLMVNELREAAPLGETGETRRGIEAMPTGPTSATIRSTGKGGEYVEKGTQPHVIRPRNAKALRFLAGGGRISQPGPNQRIATRAGGVQFAMVVNHPGTPPRPWFGPLVEKLGDFLERARARVRV